MSLKKFLRSSRDRKVAGLFGGLGESFGIDPAYFRLGFILIAIFTGVIPLLIGYAIAWVITQDEAAGKDGGERGAHPPPESRDLA